MTSKQVIKHLEEIHWQRMLEAHHDSYDLTQPDLEALDCVISLLKLLDEQKLTDLVIVGELYLAAGMKR